ncbi:MAG: hypothetical protein SFX72_08980 [Isosphaeraceae bacterium]|nr:hypothetical protein [Isosphaeraceae bacterium]
MNKLVPRLPRKHSVGIAVGDDAISICRIAQSPFGTSVVERQTRTIEGKRVETLLADLLAPIAEETRGHDAAVTVGLAARDIFFATRPLKALNCEATPQMLLHEMLRSSSLNIDDMEVDLIKHQIAKQPAAGIVACQKRRIEPILQALGDHGLRPHQVEPGLCGLLRLAIRRHPSPSRSPNVLRVFLGTRGAMAVLTHGDFPVLWRPLALSQGSENSCLDSLHRCIERLARQSGLEGKLDALMIHGRPGLELDANRSIWNASTCKISRHADPELDNESIAEGLALAAFSRLESFNLTRAMKPPINVLRHVPWGQVVVQAGLMIAASFHLAGHLGSLDDASRAVMRERMAIPWLQEQNLGTLQEEKRRLDDRLEVIRGFLGGKILWTNGIREFAEGLPGEMVLTSFEGRCEYRPDPKGRENPRQSKRSLIATIEAPIPKDEAVPREIEGLLGSLRGNPKIRADLPTIELGTLRWGTSGVSKAAMASFTVVCLPKAQAAAPKQARPQR